MHPPVVLSDPIEEKESPEPTPLHEPVKEVNEDENKEGDENEEEDDWFLYFK